MPKREFVPQGLNRNELCLLWPRCCCSKTLNHWSKVIAEDKLPTTVPELRDAEVLIYYALECAGLLPRQGYPACLLNAVANELVGPAASGRVPHGGNRGGD